jgi:hypothetical protein
VEGAVYILCAVTALACGLFLLRGFRRSRSRLLLWCGLFFLFIAVENAVLFIDLVVLSDAVSLLVLRRAVGLGGVIVLVYGLVWDGE